MPSGPPAPLRARIERVILAITEATIADELGVDTLDGVPFVAETAAILSRRLFGMQSLLAGGLATLTLLLDTSTVASHGHRFSALPLRSRRQVMAWARAVPLGVVNNFTAFYEKLGGFTFWSLLEEHGRLDVALRRPS